MEGDVVVVGIDGSEGSARALRWAAQVAAARGGRVRAVLVWSHMDQAHLEGEPAFDPAYDDEAAMKVLDHHVVQALGAGADAVERAVVCDRPASGLLQAAEGAALLVVGARGLGGFKGLLLGSVSQACLHHAAGPVAVVHGDRDPEEPRIVVGVDGSPNGDAALRWAVEHARASGAALDVLHTWHPIYTVAAPVGLPAPSIEDCRAAGQAVLDRSFELVDTSGVGAVRPLLVNGSAARELVAASEGASMVVVGARGLDGFAGLLLGSVTTKVARHARCPVVVVPAEDRADR